MESNQTLKIIGIAIAALAAAGAAYLLLQPVPVVEEKKAVPPKRSQSPQRAERPPGPKVVEVHEEAPKHAEKLTLDAYLDCLRHTNENAKKRFAELKKKFIHDRRNAKSDEEYEEIVRKFKAKEKTVMHSSFEDMLAQKSVDKNIFESAKEEFLNKLEVAAERESLKQAISVGQAPEELGVEKLKEIMQREIQLLADAHSVEDEVKNVETICKIEDQIFKEFGFEIDDVRAASIKFQAEVKALSRQILRNYHRFKL